MDLVFDKGVRKTTTLAIQRWLKAGYRRVLGLIARWPRAVIAVVVVVCAAGADAVASRARADSCRTFARATCAWTRGRRPGHLFTGDGRAGGGPPRASC